MNLNYLKYAVAVMSVCTPCIADQYESSKIRFTTGASFYTLEIEDDSGQVYREQTHLVPTSLTFQSKQGVFGGAGYTLATLDKIEMDDITFDVEEDFSVYSLLLGYRTPMSYYDRYRYWGARLSYSENNETFSSASNAALFIEKDSEQRFGRISLSYEQSTGAIMWSLSGTHVWFFTRQFGAGVNWALGRGIFDDAAFDKADSTAASFGITFVPRGTL